MSFVFFLFVLDKSKMRIKICVFIMVSHSLLLLIVHSQKVLNTNEQEAPKRDSKGANNYHVSSLKPKLVSNYRRKLDVGLTTLK